MMLSTRRLAALALLTFLAVPTIVRAAPYSLGPADVAPMNAFLLWTEEGDGGPAQMKTPLPWNMYLSTAGPLLQGPYSEQAAPSGSLVVGFPQEFSVLALDSEPEDTPGAPPPVPESPRILAVPGPSSLAALAGGLATLLLARLLLAKRRRG